MLALHPKIFDVAVIGVPDAEMGEQVKAVVQLRAGVTPSTNWRPRSSPTCATASRATRPRSRWTSSANYQFCNRKAVKRVLIDRYA